MSSGNRGILQVFRRAARKAKNFRLFTKRSSFEGFFASKGAAYALPDGDFARRASKHGGEMQLHLQAMVNLLRDEDVLRLVVQLESQYPNRIRYLTIVSAFGQDEEEQSIIMGVDWTDKATIGLVVPLYRDTTINLDGDGGFKMTSADRSHIFKPISVQTMWTALQWIHKCSENARRHNYFYLNDASHAWVEYYYRKISSDRLCINEWEQMDDIESKRPESPIGTSPEKELITKLIRHKLREIMARVDLEEVTCRQLRTMLEEDTQMELKEYRSFIDTEMIVIMGQMDSASKIFDHVYLGSEWNASNLEELKENGVGYILNITREIDNFFPGTFHYHNIRVYDLDETELLHHWDNTYRFIQRAKNAGSKVLVHCRMGISRSASTVIAYGMKEYGWSLGETMKYVKARRSVVQPNAGFWKQLITYEGILISSKNRNHWADVAVSNSPAAVKKRREKSLNSADNTDEQPQMALHVESVDTVDIVPIEAESSLKHESSDESIEELGVLRATSENTSELVEDASLERNKADHVPETSSPIGPEPESTVEPSKEALEEPNYVPSSSRVTEIPVIEKTALQRVSSDPTLSKDDQKRQAIGTESLGNFRRSCSLRERGTRKLQKELNTKARSASDENLKEFARKKKQILGMDEPEASDLQDAKNTVEGLLPSDLHGVLESGFVKRYSRKFEGDDIVPELESSVALMSKEETDVELAPAEGGKVIEEEQDESMPNEEPEPGVVKKHKEGYEMKHRETLKRRALLQRGGSDERKSAKQEGDEVEGSLTVDADSESVQTAGELEDELRGVNVVALVKKVNEDMKKEVNVRRISASKKQQELRAYVENAGEQMKNTLCDAEDETLPNVKSTVADEADSEQLSEESFIGKIKRNTRVFVLEEDTQDLPSNDSQLTGTFESSQPVVLKPSVAQNVSARLESVEQQTFVIEETLQSLDQEELEKRISDEGAQEGHHGVDKEVGLSLSKGQTNSADSYKEVENRTISQNENVGMEPLTEITPGKTETSELLDDKRHERSEQNPDNVPQKGLVKRHTLLIEGKLQPLDQEFEKSVERQSEQERHISVGEKNSAAFLTERTEVNVVQNMDCKEKNNSEIANTCELVEDGESTEFGDDTANVPPKGLVKHHTLLIEGKIQPLDQEFEKNVEKETESETERTDDQDACASLKGDRPVEFESQQDGLSVTQDMRTGVEPLENSASGAEEPTALSEDIEDKGSEQDTENFLQRGLVKRHTLLIEGKLQPLDQELDKDVEKEDGKEIQLVLNKEAVLPVEDQGQLRYQIERTSDSEVEQCAEDYHDNESVSGLVKREKLRIEERLQTSPVKSKQELEQVLAGSDNAVLEDVDGESCKEVDKKEKGGEEIEEEVQQSEVAVDTSSVVRVKEQTQHLEGIIRVKSQTSKDGDPKASDEAPKFFIVPRACSDENVNEGDEINAVEKINEDRMNVLSDSAVNVALLKAQENLDSEKENTELDNKHLVDWEHANVKQRRQIFENNVCRGEEESENKSNSLRRHESMPKMTRDTEKPAFRRRSVSDVTATVSSGSDRRVGYTIVFRNRVDASSSSSSLPRDWSPLEYRHREEDKDVSQVFSPEISRKDKLKKNASVEFNDGRDTCQSVKETIQVLDSKNQRNISNIS